jgi:hypothetical protein
MKDNVMDRYEIIAHALAILAITVYTLQLGNYLQRIYKRNNRASYGVAGLIGIGIVAPLPILFYWIFNSDSRLGVATAIGILIIWTILGYILTKEFRERSKALN